MTKTGQRYLVLVKAAEGHVCLPINLDDDFLGTYCLPSSSALIFSLYAAVAINMLI